MKGTPPEKKILFAINSKILGNGGISQVARNMIKVTKGAENLDHYPTDFKIVAFDEHPNSHSGFWYSSILTKLRFYIRIRKASLHCTHFIYDSCNMAQAHPRFPLLRRPSMTFIHGIEVWEKAKPAWINACRKSQIIIANSSYTKERAEKSHHIFSRAQVCWLGTETDDVPKPIVPLASRKPEVLIVGRMDNRENYKGHSELIQAWKKVKDKILGATLHIVGSGSNMNKMKELAKNTDTGQSIIFHGHLTGLELEKLYARAMVFAMPSRGEGFGLVYIEAMRHGLPVIASIHDAAKEIVEHGTTGFTVNLDHPDDLPKSLIKLLKDPQYAAALGKAGQKRWQNNFTFSQFKKRFLPIFTEFIGEN